MDTPTSDMHDYLQALETYHHIAIVGISANPNRPSHDIAIYLQAAGYDIIPINPRYAGQTLLGKHVYPSLTAAKEAGVQIEIVDVFRKAEHTPPVAQEAATIGAKLLWLQLGISNEDAKTIAQNAGLSFVQDRCIKVEHARYIANH